MSRPFEIDIIVKDEYRGDFQRMLLDRGVTIDAIRSWLAERGCSVSRSSIGRYRNNYRAQQSGVMASTSHAGFASEGEARNVINSKLAKLNGVALVRVAAFLDSLLVSGGDASE